MPDTPETDTTPTPDGQGTPAPAEPTTPVTPEPTAPAEPEDVQPTDAPTTQPDGGQGLIAPYLEGVDETHRDAVADVLERYRQDSDAQVTHKFEALKQYQQYAEDPTQLEVPVALYENLMEQPLQTVQWIIERFKTEGGIDLGSQLLEALNAEPAEPATETTPAEDDPKDKPLTMAELERYEQEKAQQARQSEDSQRRRELAKGWLDEATTSAGLELGEGDVSVRHAILSHAAQLAPQFKHLGEKAGQEAIKTAVEAFTNRFGKTTPGTPGEQTPEPVTANGGTPPAPAEADMTDPKARREFMKSILTAQNSQE